MPATYEFDTDELLHQAEAGQADAVQALFQRHRSKLRRMVEVRLDPRLRKRLDPSDVVQETLAEGVRQLEDFLQNRPMPFYAWLRQIAWARLIDLHRRHVTSLRRSVDREQAEPMHLSDESVRLFAQKLLARGASPSESIQRKEMRERVRFALNELSASDRDVLLLRHLEQLSVSETAQVLRIPEGTVKSRHYRALSRLKGFLKDLGEDAG